MAVVGVAVGMLSLGAGFAACSSSSGGNNTGPGGGGGNDASTGGEGGVQTQCANPTVEIDFSPMYSAFIPGSTQHSFQVPAIADDGAQADWSSSDTSKATVMPTMIDGNTPGAMITMTGTGTVTITAKKSDGSCGTSTLTITSATENDWKTGNARYNNGNSLHLGPPDGGYMRPDGGFGEGGFMGGGGGFDNDSGCGFVELDGGTACTNCHGAGASTLFNDVSHTPEQTGGFSDDDLIQIIVYGNVPDGGYFDPGVIISGCEAGAQPCSDRAYQRWHALHQWCDITPDEYTGIVTYLRSLTPAPQNGTSNFGGHHRDGGRPPMNDSGGPPPQMDSGSSSSDASGE